MAVNNDENINRWVRYAEENQIPRSYHSPPMDLLLRKLGIQKTPVLFWSLPKVMALFGIWFALIWGGLMYLIIWRGEAKEPREILILSASAGLLFGSSMAIMYRRFKRQRGLTTWSEFLARTK